MTDRRCSSVARLFVAGSDRPALVDVEFAEFARYRWKLDPRGAVIREGDRVVKLAREIVSAARGAAVVHRNGDQLDNRRDNLLYPATLREARAHQVHLRRASIRLATRELDLEPDPAGGASTALSPPAVPQS